MSIFFKNSREKMIEDQCIHGLPPVCGIGGNTVTHEFAGVDLVSSLTS